MDKLAKQLSGGWRQRLALATTILHEPRLMFLDEPTAGIDPVARRELWDLLFDLAASGSNIFMTTQYMDEVERCGEVGYLYLSNLIMTGSPNELKTRTLRDAGGMRFVEFESSSAPRAAQWLRTRPYCESATVFGTAVHALVRNEISEMSIRTEGNGAGLGIRSVRTIEPTLEDVFVTLTKRSADARKS
jgi:ABC-type multidrug transport system ATPase subunit